jgi:uncharacterized protein (DUF983 family)
LTQHDERPISVTQTALRCVCPHCTAAPLFDGFLNVHAHCPACGFDYEKVDSGDGPAIFIILIVGFIVAGGALLVEVAFQSPYWVHAVLWVPATFLLALGLLRPFKAALIALQYKHKAAEGRPDFNGR